MTTDNPLHPAMAAMVPLDNDGNPILAKVLPAGAPLVATHWTCPTCGLTVRGSPARVCMDDCNPDCPIGGDL